MVVEKVLERGPGFHRHGVLGLGLHVAAGQVCEMGPRMSKTGAPVSNGCA